MLLVAYRIFDLLAVSVFCLVTTESHPPPPLNYFLKIKKGCFS